MSNPTELPDLDKLVHDCVATTVDILKKSGMIIGLNPELCKDIRTILIKRHSRAQPEGEAPQADTSDLPLDVEFKQLADTILQATTNGTRLEALRGMAALFDKQAALHAPAASLSPLCGAQHAEMAQLVKERDGWKEESEHQKACYERACESVEMLRDHERKQFWVGQGDGSDNLASMSRSMSILIRAEQLRVFAAQHAESGKEVAVQYIPIATDPRDAAQGSYPNDNIPADPMCQAALDARGDDRGQGLDPYWKWGFRAGWQALAAQQAAAPCALEPVPMCEGCDNAATLHSDGTTGLCRECLADDASAPGTPEAPQTAAARDVLAERQRQMQVEGWTLAHDDKYRHSELAHGAAAYALVNDKRTRPACWPWAAEWWKPLDDRRNLVRAGALVLAEIERLDRAAQLDGGQEGSGSNG